MDFLADAVCVIAVALQTNHLKTLVHTNDINKNIHIIKEIENEFLDPMVRGIVIGAFWKSIKSEIEEILDDHDVRIGAPHILEF